MESIRKVTKSILDVHLMITDPDKFASIFIEAGADPGLSVHYEAATHLDRTVRHIQSLGARAGVVLNPATPVALLGRHSGCGGLLVLVMSVNPGFGGQPFIPNSLRKIQRLDRMRRERGLGFQIQIDGGVRRENVEAIVRAGCDWLVAGSSIFHSADSTSAVRDLQQAASGALAIRI